MERIKKLFIQYKEIIMYLIMGGGTTVVNWGVYAVCISVFDNSVSAANIIAWTAAVVFAYITNKIFVFESYSWEPRFILKEVSLFVSSRLATGLLEIVSVPALVQIGLNQSIFGIKGMVSKVFVSLVVVILNYILSKILIFKKEK